jgi:hypothetical protein
MDAIADATGAIAAATAIAASRVRNPFEVRMFILLHQPRK